MTGSSLSRFRTRYAETDQMGVIHHSAYLAWCEVGRTDFIRALGTTYAEIERSGVFLTVADVSVRYRTPARYDDLIEVETSLAAVRSRTVTFDYEIRRMEPDPAQLARATTTLVCTDTEGRTRRLPAALSELFGVAP